MKIINLINLQDTGAIEKIKQIEMDGKRTLKVRRLIRDISNELQPVNDARNAYIKNHGKNNRLQPDDAEAFLGYVKLMEEIGGEETEIKITPIIKIEDLPKISSAQLDALINCGIVEDET